MKALYNEIDFMIKKNEIENIKGVFNMLSDDKLKELLSIPNDVGWTLLFHAVAESSTDPEIVQLLVDSGSPLDHFDSHGNTAIFFVEKYVFGDILKKGGATIDIKNNYRGHTALFHCISPEQTQTMLKLGLNPNARDSEYNTPLFTFNLSHQDSKDSLAIGKLLLEAGGNPDAMNCYGETPLFHVHSIECAALLVEYGADLNYVDKEGLSVIDFLHRQGITNVAEYLVRSKKEKKIKNVEQDCNFNPIDFM